MSAQITYNEVDFLLPAQKFVIGYSFVSQRGLPFYREFVLRLIQLAPVSKNQVAIFFGFSRAECDEAILDLVDRGEVTISNDNRLTLTDKSRDYFSDIGESPRLAAVQDGNAVLYFDLATFTCLGKNHEGSKWKAGISLSVSNELASQSETMVEKKFQRNFNEIFDSGYLPEITVPRESKEAPSIYTVNRVNRLRQVPVRLITQFKMDASGLPVEREDFGGFKNSDVIHELMTDELASVSNGGNLLDCIRCMLELSDNDTPKLFGSGGGAIKLQFLEDLNRLEANAGDVRRTFVGQVYSKDNWGGIQKVFAHGLKSFIDNKGVSKPGKAVWLAPSDYFWGKSLRFAAAMSDFFRRSNIGKKKGKDGKVLYEPSLYVPISSASDIGSARRWVGQLESLDKVFGLQEGFLGGAVEVLYLENCFVAVVYHVSQSDILPVTMPVGFVSRDHSTVSHVGGLISNYINGIGSCGEPNNFGRLSELVARNNS
ncbi:hypothetical protein OC926_17865 [Pseudomonas peradeniyensis]|uniref:hypothetical protein n=1 Tax=Pseudomonas TaxID=286 RepID=UPI000A5A0161|nr:MULTISPECIES: hypothetical protein [Pseudomonas]MCU7281718.1 hypothetical protein [Pseudomonas peradeniyensis]QZA52553.1 hypothetical protein K2O50_16130 [Pseudomonas sp. 2hn]